MPNGRLAVDFMSDYIEIMLGKSRICSDGTSSCSSTNVIGSAKEHLKHIQALEAGEASGI